MQKSEMTLYGHFLAQLGERSGRVFLFDDEKKWSFQEVFQTSVCLANRLSSWGVRSGDKVAFRFSRSIEGVLLFYALMFLDCFAFLSDPHNPVEFYWSKNDLKEEPDFYLSNEVPHEGSERTGDWILFDRHLGLYHRLLIESEYEEARFPLAYSSRDPAVVIFTSGSTGSSKKVVLSQRNLLNHIINYSEAGSYRHDDVSIALLPFQHVFGLAVILMGEYQGYSVYFPPVTTPEALAPLFVKKKITRLDGVPSFALALAKEVVAQKLQGLVLRVGVIGGAPVSESQMNFIETALGLKLVPVYGESECIGISGTSYLDSPEHRHLSVGRFLPFNEGKILGESSESLPIGEVGEIAVRSPALMLGYYEEGKPISLETEAGFFRTGDLGYLDEEGYLHLTGRKKDIIIKNGINISAKKVEEALEKIPEVMEAVVVGKVEEERGEEVCAYVVLEKPGSLTEKSLKKALWASLFKNEIPDRVHFALSLPLTPSGKPDKMAIKHFFETEE